MFFLGPIISPRFILRCVVFRWLTVGHPSRVSVSIRSFLGRPVLAGSKYMSEPLKTCPDFKCVVRDATCDPLALFHPLQIPATQAKEREGRSSHATPAL